LEELLKERELLRCLKEGFSDLIFIKDRNGFYRGCNRASERFIGLSEEEQLGKSEFDFFNRETAEAIRKFDRELLERGKPHRVQEWVPDRDGNMLFLVTLKTPYYGSDGELLGLVGISRDITERRRSEEDILKFNEELEQRVRERTKELERRNYELEQLNKVFVGRELRMVELKEKIWELEGKR
jgi:PAS domain S-box-containing protein